MNHKSVGEISEAVVIAELVKSGKTVLLPFGDNKRYDLVVDDNGNFTRIQIKTAWVKNGCLTFNTSSVSPFTNKRTDYKGEADMFMVYSPDLDKVYCIPVNEAPTGSMMLRFEEPKKTQMTIKWAKDYEYAGL
jgi:hypothetical protein